MRILLAAVLTVRLWAVEVGVDQKHNTVAEEVHEIAGVMWEIENQLRDDKTDALVQLNLKEAIDRIEKLIKDAEELPAGNADSDYKRGLRALKDSDTKGDVKRPQVASHQEPYEFQIQPGDWASLPRKERGEIVQVWASEVPLRWKQRIAAYFLSLNAVESEAKKENKKP